MSWRPFVAIVSARLSFAAVPWFADALAAAAQRGATDRTFLAAWNGMGRHLGGAPVLLSQTEMATLGSEAAVAPQRWALDELGRAVLLLSAMDVMTPEQQERTVVELFRKGELRQQQALARVLGYLPDPGRFVGVAADAIRSNALSLLEIMVGGNAFPAMHLPELTFNQMVVKALFNDISLQHLPGLGRRCTSELVRMVRAMVSERTAAGRPVPADVALITQGEPDATV